MIILSKHYEMNFFFLLLFSIENKFNEMVKIMHSIRDLSAITGIKPHTIRIWEKRYNLLTPSRTETNIRYYDDTQLKKLLNIAYLNKQGMRVSKIAKFSDKELCDTVLYLSGDSFLEADHYEGLLSATLDFDENRIDKIINQLIINKGFEATVQNFLIAFYQRLTLLWQTKAINTAHLRFVLHIFKKKLLVAIDHLMPETHTHPHRIVFFLCEDEFVDLSLLFYYYLIKKAGHKTIHLGLSVCNQSILETIEKLDPDFLFTYSSNSTNHPKTINQINKLCDHLPSAKKLFLISDNPDDTSSPLPSLVKIVNTPGDLQNILL